MYVYAASMSIDARKLRTWCVLRDARPQREIHKLHVEQWPVAAAAAAVTR